MSTTDELLAIKFPGIRKSWLRKVCDKMNILQQENGGNVEMHVRWRHGQPQWTDWIQRDLCEMSPTQEK